MLATSGARAVAPIPLFAASSPSWSSVGLVTSSRTADARKSTFDEAAQVLANLYVDQAEILSVPLEASRMASQPTEILHDMISPMVERLKGAKLTGTDLEFVQRVPYELKAADFVAEDGLQYTVMLEQIWLRLLAIHVTQQRPDRAGAAREIAQQAETISESDDGVFGQMYELQIGLLKLWMLFQPADDRSGARTLGA